MRQGSAYDEEVEDFSPPSGTNENLTCDLLVAGGGLSGLSAADAAVRRGVNVVVIEKGIYGKEAASGLSAGQFLTGWAKPVDIMLAELARQDWKEAFTAIKRADRPSGGYGHSCAAPWRDASVSKSLIATTTSALPYNTARAPRP